MNRKNLALLFLYLTFFSGFIQAAESINLGALADYNAIIFGDFSASSSDVEGQLAAQGNINLDAYSVGDKLDSSQLHDTLISGGDITFSSGRVFYGHIKAAGSVSGIGEPVSNGMEPGSVIEGNATLPVDFDEAYDYLSSLSESLSQLTANTTFESQWGGLYLHGDCSSDIQVFDLDGSTVLSAHTFQVDCIPNNAYVIFNIAGQNPGLTNMSMDSMSSHRKRVIYNFYEAQTLTLSGIGVEGSVLAVDAEINNPQGVIKGQLIAKSWNGIMQINNDLFEGMEIVGNQAPQATDQVFSLTTDEDFSFSLLATDPNNDVLTYQLNTEGLYGTISGTPPELTFTPLTGFTGVDQFSFKVNDGQLHSDEAIITLEVGEYRNCDLYPYTVEASHMTALSAGELVSNYETAVSHGNYSLLTWNGSNDTNTLAQSFIQPGNAENYINPDNDGDNIIDMGDWVQGAPGKNNASHVRGALDALLGEVITVPLWAQTRESGSHLDYLISGF
ncbi:MAG: choice-of-anchor A family protein, partial [Xanthomonadales bacterium]|nr:choice-of-anchor A family protein [Xanthomonadales bacterium]